MVSMLSGETINVKYKVEFGIFGEIGVAEAKTYQRWQFLYYRHKFGSNGNCKNIIER